MKLEEECRREILQIHEFLEGWLTGTIGKTEEAFRLFTDALTPEFIAIFPSGSREPKERVVAEIWKAHGTKEAPYPIEIHGIETRIVGPSLCLATYQEWQPGGNPSRRIATALFRPSGGAMPVEWVHLQETWLPPDPGGEGK